MTETTEHEHSSLNTLQEETDCKTVDKETVDVEEAVNDKNSSIASVVYDKNEDICIIQTEAITAAAKSMVGAAVSNEESNTSIPDIAPALNSILEADCGEGISGGTGNRASLAECPSAASILARMCHDAFKFLTRADELKSTVNTSTSRLNEHREVLSNKIAECSRSIVSLYRYQATEYQSFCLETDKIRNMETAADTCGKYAQAAAEMNTDEDVDKTLLKEFAEAICDFLEKEREVCLNMVRMWTNVQADLRIEETRERPAKKRRKEAKYYWGLFTFVCVSVAVLSIVLLNVEPVKYYVMLAIALLGLVVCILWWLHKLYKCLKKRCNRTIEDQWLKISFAEDIVNECTQRLEITNKDLEEYCALNLGEADEKKLDTQFPTTDSSERADDSSQ